MSTYFIHEENKVQRCPVTSPKTQKLTSGGGGIKTRVLLFLVASVVKLIDDYCEKISSNIAMYKEESQVHNNDYWKYFVNIPSYIFLCM